MIMHGFPAIMSKHDRTCCNYYSQKHDMVLFFLGSTLSEANPHVGFAG